MWYTQLKIKTPWLKHYYALRSRCNNKNNIGYKNYGGRGIRPLITKNEIKSLWFRDKAYLMSSPTIDRIDNDGNYKLSNCRFIEKGQNSAERNTRILSKPILQYNLQGAFIKEWNSLSIACKNYKLVIQSLSNCLRGKSKTAGGFIWKYKTQSNFQKNLSITELKRHKHSQIKAILQFDLNGNFIKKWDSTTDASKYIHTSNKNLSDCALGRSKTSKGFIWRYK